jgi:PAS domain S-box-containing protein
MQSTTRGRKSATEQHEMIDESRLANLINDASIDQILVLDYSLRIIAWNKACEQISGLPKEAVIGKTLVEVYKRAAEYPAIMEGIVNGLKGFKSFVPWEKGSYNGGYFEHHFIPLRNEENEVIGVLNIIHDVAHRIKAEKELQSLNRALGRKNRELQRKTEELTNFNWIASHDLKEPLRKIYTFIEMVATQEGQKISDAARSNLRRAQSAVQRMGLLTDDIVTFSQVTAPTEKVDYVDLQETVNLALRKHQRMIDENGAELEIGQLPAIKGYPEMIGLMIYHVLGNAIKFHAEGAKPKVHVEYKLTSGKDIAVAEAEADADYHCISFTDNGIGFSEEYNDKIFGMFQRLHPPGVYKGTGMGLPVSRKVAEAHEGFITVKSEEGIGSIFCCYLKDLDDHRGGRALITLP